MRQPGIEPGSIAWKATMLTFTPPTLLIKLYFAAESFNFAGTMMKFYIIPPLVLIFSGTMMKFYIIPPLWNDDDYLKTQIFYYKNICVSRESNPDLLLGRQQC